MTLDDLNNINKEMKDLQDKAETLIKECDKLKNKRNQSASFAAMVSFDDYYSCKRGVNEVTYKRLVDLLEKFAPDLYRIIEMEISAEVRDIKMQIAAKQSQLDRYLSVVPEVKS